MTDKNLFRFFILAFLLGWLIWIPLLLDYLGIFNLGLSQSLLPLGFLAPILSASILTSKESGKKGLSKLFKGLLKFKVKWSWYVAILIPALLTSLTHLIFAAFFGYEEFIGIDNILIGYLFISVFLILEEVGWRGYALPRLQKKYTALNAALILGFIWAVWHFPFWAMAPIEGAPEPFYLFYITGSLGAIVMSVILTWIFNNTQGSLALTTLCHASFNATIGAITFSKAEAIYHNVLLVILGLVTASIIVLIFGKQHLCKHRKNAY